MCYALTVKAEGGASISSAAPASCRYSFSKAPSGSRGSKPMAAAISRYSRTSNRRSPSCIWRRRRAAYRGEPPVDTKRLRTISLRRDPWCGRFLSRAHHSLAAGAATRFAPPMKTTTRRSLRRAWRVMTWPLASHIVFALGIGFACGIAAIRYPEVITPTYAAILGTVVLYPCNGHHVVVPSSIRWEGQVTGLPGPIKSAKAPQSPRGNPPEDGDNRPAEPSPTDSPAYLRDLNDTGCELPNFANQPLPSEISVAGWSHSATAVRATYLKWLC